MALLPAASARVMLPAVLDGRALGIDVVGHGAPQSPRHRSRPRTEDNTSLGGSSRRSLGLRPTPLQQRNSMEMEATNMLRAVIDGRMSGSEFARHLAANATDISWLDATGQAVSELGVLLQSANAAAVERSKLQFATALRTIDEHKRALSSLTSERDALLSKLNQAEEQSKHQKETIDFLSTFSPRQPHPPASDEKKGRNFARAVKAAYGKKVAAAVAASEAAVDAEVRQAAFSPLEQHTPASILPGRQHPSGSQHPSGGKLRPRALHPGRRGRIASHASKAYSRSVTIR